jgi:SET domain-containing protein
MKKVRVGESRIAGKGLFAAEDIKKGEAIRRFGGERAREEEIDARYAAGEFRWDDPFELGGGEYLLLDATSLAGNHSCNPNAGIRGTRELFALRAIKKGEEITYDYSTVVGENAPGESDWLMRCACGARTCRKTIGNWQSLSPRRLNYYKKLSVLPRFVLAQSSKTRG